MTKRKRTGPHAAMAHLIEALGELLDNDRVFVAFINLTDAINLALETP